MQVEYRHPGLSIDQQLALRTAATNLAREFDGTFGAETIDRFLHSSYDEFASRAVVLHYLPLLAERFARQRLRALAKVEGKHTSGVPVVLFLCTHNAGRSQMALGFFQHLAGDRALAWSGGSEPATTINPFAIAGMRERGIDISAEYPKPWTDEVVRAADVVITMGCGDACPIFPAAAFVALAASAGCSTAPPRWRSACGRGVPTRRGSGVCRRGCARRASGLGSSMQ
jgi:arsenate reductase (thioredoxin)